MCVPIENFNMSSLISPEENSPASGPCNITLYSEELWLGASVTFHESVPNLSIWDFEDKLESVKVEGSCKWEVYTGETLSLSVCLSLSLCL